MMLTEICADIRNWFCRDDDKHFGTYIISGGSLAPLPFLQQGQYFRIIGSTFNDGIYQYPAVNLTDEEFKGAIWAMRVPPSLIAIASEIEAYCKSEEAKPSAYTSESFAGYSYSKAAGTNGAPLSWREVFAKRLNEWRKL